jgi:hypothetical protein
VIPWITTTCKYCGFAKSNQQHGYGDGQHTFVQSQRPGDPGANYKPRQHPVSQETFDKVVELIRSEYPDRTEAETRQMLTRRGWIVSGFAK